MQCHVFTLRQLLNDWNNVDMEKVKLNQWDIDLNWCPSQIYYYFKDAVGDNWCIYLRWRWQDPWTAELVRCDEEWEFLWNSPETVDLLAEENHVPGTVAGYYRDEEYRELMDNVLEIVRNLSPKFSGI